MGDLDEFLCKISTESLSANLYWLWRILFSGMLSYITG
jgi:hypothetical protein